MTSPRSGKTQANKTLERLLALSDGDLRNCLGTAIEYSDHASIAGAQNLPAAKRLQLQLELALGEAEYMVRAR